MFLRNIIDSERCRGFLPPPGLSSAVGSSDDDNFSLDWGYASLPQRHDSRLKPFRGSDIDDHYMVIVMVNQTVAIGQQLRVARTRQLTLEHGELNPFPVSMHHLVYLAPALVVSDVVDYEIDFLLISQFPVSLSDQIPLTRPSSGQKVGVFRNFAEQVTRQQSGLHFEQAAILHRVAK